MFNSKTILKLGRFDFSHVFWLLKFYRTSTFLVNRTSICSIHPQRLHTLFFHELGIVRLGALTLCALLQLSKVILELALLQYMELFG